MVDKTIEIIDISNNNEGESRSVFVGPSLADIKKAACYNRFDQWFERSGAIVSSMRSLRCVVSIK